MLVEINNSQKYYNIHNT